MKKCLQMLSAAIVIGPLRVNIYEPKLLIFIILYFVVVVVALLFYVHCKHLSSYRDGQLT